MVISRLLHTKTGKYMLSVILGLGLASLFRSACKGKNCLVYSAPSVEDVDGQVFKYNDKCYTYTPSHTKCTSGKTLALFK